MCFRDAGAREPVSGGRGERTVAPGRPVLHGDGHQAEDRLPLLPAVEAGEIVGAHQPDELDARKAAAKEAQRAFGIGGADAGLEGRHLDARVVRNLPA